MRFTEAMHQAGERGLKSQTRRPLTPGNCNLTRGEFQHLDLNGGRADVASWPVSGLKCRLEIPGGRRSVTVLPRIQPGSIVWARRGQSGEGARRANARLFLRVLQVSATRLCEITETDALAEGVEVFAPPGDHWHPDRLPERLAAAYEFQLGHLGKKYLARWRAGEVDAEVAGRLGRASARHNFALLFESINGPGSWARNPWVWRYRFERVEPEQMAA
jgi:hypothetical protein